MTPAGVAVITTSVNSSLSDTRTCGFNPLTAECTSLSNRSLAIVTDPTCAVTVYALGDPGCSQDGHVTLLQG